MENNSLHKKYGLFTAIALVIGIVIGSGVFFKAEKVLNATGGNLPIGILSWIIGGLIMISCSFVFAVMATKYEKVNGIIDYAEVTVGKTYGYYVGWFMATIYYPAITSVLAWVSARYTCVLFGWSIVGGECMAVSCFYLCMSYVINAYSPKLAGKFQVTTTIIKLIPLILMAIVGTISGLSNGILVTNFTSVAVKSVTGSPLLTAVVATAFAYEGWIIATSINSELKDSKKNLPIALFVGSIIIVAIYLLYYVGLAGAVDNAVVMESGEQGAKIAFSRLFSNIAGTGLFVLVVISCLGTLNGLMLGCTRGLYSIATRNLGPNPKALSSVDTFTDMPSSSAVLAMGLCGFWLLYFFFGCLMEKLGPVKFDSSEIAIVTLYAMYIPIFIQFIRKETSEKTFKRFIMPIVSIIACIFMVYAAIVAHGIQVVYYLIVFAVFMVVGYFFKNSAKRNPEKSL